MKIKGTIQQIHLRNGERELLDQLKDKAIDESKTDESIYQIIFIDNLRSRGLISNALYYLDLFIETNNSFSDTSLKILLNANPFVSGPCNV